MADTAGRWVRVSGDSQSEADQLPDIDAYCDDKGYIKGKPYEVHGKSAYKGAQDPDWQKVVRDIQDDVIDVVVCWMVDRLDRQNILHAIPMVLEVLNAGGRIEFSEQPECNLDAKSPDIDEQVKRFGDRIHAANQESKIKSKRVLKAHKKRRAMGSALGRAAWGYEIWCDMCQATPVKPRCKDHKKIFKPTADGRKYIPVIFDRVISGDTLRDIAEWLTAENVRTETGNTIWNETFIGHGLIKNQIYYGARRNGGELETEAMITPSVYQEANAVLKTRSRPGRDASVRGKALLAPICGECYGKPREGCPSGISPMYRIFCNRGKIRGGIVAFYRCSGHGPQRKGCGFNIEVAELDGILTESILSSPAMREDRKYIPGDDKSDEIAKLREKGADAMRQGNYPAAMEAMKQAEELESAPRVKPHYERILTNQSEADYFRALDAGQRRKYLAAINVRPTRDGINAIGPRMDYFDVAA